MVAAVDGRRAAGPLLIAIKTLPSTKLKLSLPLTPKSPPRARHLEQRLEAAAAAAVSQLTNNIVASNASQTPEQLEGTNCYDKKLDLWSFFAG